MRVGVLTNAFCERDMIVGCIKQFQDNSFPWHHQVLVSKKPWHGEWEADDTHVIATNLGADVIVGNWQNASEQLNYGLEIFRDFDWVVICDADERYTSEDLDRLWLHLEAFRRETHVRAIRTDNWSVYWKTPYWEIFPKQTDYPLIVIRPSEQFGNIRSYEGPTLYVHDVHMYHLSYVRDDNEMQKKVESFDASTEFDPIHWYQSVWLDWNPTRGNLHPVHPEQFAYVDYKPVPAELKQYIPERYWK